MDTHFYHYTIYAPPTCARPQVVSGAGCAPRADPSVGNFSLRLSNRVLSEVRRGVDETRCETRRFAYTSMLSHFGHVGLEELIVRLTTSGITHNSDGWRSIKLASAIEQHLLAPAHEISTVEQPSGREK